MLVAARVRQGWLPKGVEYLMRPTSQKLKYVLSVYRVMLWRIGCLWQLVDSLSLSLSLFCKVNMISYLLELYIFLAVRLGDIYSVGRGGLSE